MNLDQSMSLVIERLQRNRYFPKYQLERSIDGFLSLFVEEYLGLLYRSAVTYVAAEFPIKKATSNQSTNIDYVLFRHRPAPAWLFVELKTDEFSIRAEQLAAYNQLPKRAMPGLLQQIEQDIMPNSSRPDKYQYLLNTINQTVPFVDQTAPIIPIYITGHSLSEATKALYDSIEWIELSQFANQLSATQHPDLWKHVRQLLNFLPAP